MKDRSRSLRKPSGGRLVANRKGRQYAKVNDPVMPKIGETKRRSARTIGGNIKFQVIQGDKITVHDKQNKASVATIESVVENAADRNFQIRNIFNKGAVVKTDKGLVRITSRPGQTGSLSGVLVE